MSDRNKILELFESKNEYFEKAAQEGIEKHRKGDAFITVSDENGIPISDASIRITQKSHEFRFGANIFMLDELETEEKNEKYKSLFKELFNMATLPFYWDALEPEKGETRYTVDSKKIYRRPPPDLCIDFCKENGIEPREHALAYDGFYPKWLYDASVEEVKAELERRFSEVGERYRDKIPTIEVNNELFWEKGRTKFYHEPDYVEWCYKTAEKYFPNNQLGINECTMRSWKDNCDETDRYYALIKRTIESGARIDAIGMQYHLFFKREEEYASTRRLLDPENLYRHMDLYSAFKKPLQITEVTVPAYSWEKEDEEIQAEIIEKLYTLWFSHPSVEQIVYWNLVDGYAHLWDPDPEKIKASLGNMSIGENYYYGGLIRFDLSPKPAYLKLMELIKEKWHTEAAVTTDKNGVCSFRGFYGEYVLEIRSGSKCITKQVNVSKKSDNKINVVL